METNETNINVILFDTFKLLVIDKFQFLYIIFYYLFRFLKSIFERYQEYTY